MKILINRYHPACEDLAISFSKLGHEVFLSVKTSINDHYGSWKKVFDECKDGYKEFTTIDYKQALIMISKGQFDLVGVDGVFEGDADILDICNRVGLPHFSISGYPGVLDEPSNNILSLGWSMPNLQYWQKFPSEAHRKLHEWREIAVTGKSPGKNICVFYPNFWRLKEKENLDSNFWNNVSDVPYFVSGIQKFKECNPWNYEVFQQVKSRLERPNFFGNGGKKLAIVENCEGLTNSQFISKLESSWGLLHLKQADQPGISVLEALLLGKIVITMKSFVLASHNQDILIDGLNAIVADSIDELVERVSELEKHQVEKRMYPNSYSMGFIYKMTSFDRQKNKLQRFVEECVK